MQEGLREDVRDAVRAGQVSGSGMDIGINKDVCIGAGQCALLAPRVFTQDDEGLSELAEDWEQAAAGPGAPVREAARACPVGAISVTDVRSAS
ncbi:ferredoxin [Streptomyces candidus]|uniref:Ferredoxin n=2 Tax=Streptomyces candidus TaxID=67283 RepID=A0A7X0HEM9_9ACTN|nr:ferredoxin [Streptomyces candidus]